MDDPSAAGASPRRSGRLFLLALVCLGSLWLGSRGLRWPAFHPDEYPIAEWIQLTEGQWSLTARVYAGGFFTLARPIQLAARAVSRGLHARAFHQGATDLPAGGTFDAILFARWLNVWLAALTCLLIYGLARRITGSGGAGVLAAALFAFAQFTVEHSHYGETDLAMVFVLALACRLWAGAIAGRSGLIFAAAALAGGFAAGTKFTLVLLAAVPLAMALLGLGLPGRSGPGRRLGYAGLGLLLFALGLVLANPRIVADGSGFLAGLSWEARRLQGETAMNMGMLHGNVAVRYGHHLLELGHNFLTLGWGWILLALLGLPWACSRQYRKYGPLLILFPALFAGYWIFGAPWVRSQEFLVFLPILATLAVLPPLALWRTRRAPLRALAAALAGVALLSNAANGLRVSALFGWTDTRLLARQWMEQRLPETARLAAEPYVEQACPELPHPPAALGGKIERLGLAPLAGQGLDFIVRAASHTGRGLRHPLTGQRFPEAQQRFDEFCEGYERLAAWGPRAPCPLATFASPTLELWGLKPPAAAVRLDVELPQPLWLHDVYLEGKLRPTVFPEGRRLGSALGMIVDSRPRVLAVGGPAEPGPPAYLVLNTEEREAVVRVRGAAWRRRVSLAPYSAAIVPLDRLSWPGGLPFERLTLAAAPREDVLYLPCYARIVFGAAEAARVCADLDRPEAFWTVFGGEALERMADPVQAYLLAVRTERWDLADRWEAAAVQAAAGLAQSLSATPAEISIHGNSGQAYETLARMRLQQRSPTAPLPDDHALNLFLLNSADRLMCLELMPAVPPAEPPLENSMALPLRVARGLYELSGELFIKPDPAQSHIPAEVSFTVNRRQPWIECRPAKPPTDWIPFNARFAVDSERPVVLTARSKTPVQLYFQNLTLSWSLAPGLGALDRAFQAARAAHALRRQRPAEALATLDRLDGAADLPGALEIRQLKFLAALALGEAGGPRLADAARDVLALAPATHVCLEALAGSDPAARAAAESLAANLERPAAFGPFLSLVGCTFDAPRRRLALVLEASRNDTPPLAVSLHARRRGDWRRRQAVPLGAGPYLHRGERVALSIVLSEAFGAGPDAAGIALGVETDVAWHPGTIAIAGRRGGVIPLADIRP